MSTTATRAGQVAKPAAKKKQATGYVAFAGKHSVAFGMLWTRLSGVKLSQGEINKAAANYAASNFVSLPLKGEKAMIGLLADSAMVEKGATKKNASSAAALLALAYPGLDNAVFGILLPGSKVAFMGFRNGAPLIGFDRIVNLDVLDELTSDFLKEFDEQSVLTVKFYASEGVFPGRAAELFDSAWFAQQPKKAVVATRLRRAKSRVLVIVGVLAAAAAAYGALTVYEEHQKSSLAAAKPAMVDPQVLYEKSAREYMAAATAGAMVAGPMTDKINQLPMFHRGWKLEKAACTPGACTLSWLNSGGGTYQSFASSPLPGLPEYQTAYKEGMTGLETAFTFPIDAPKGFDVAQLPKQDEFVLHFGSKAQEMKAAGVSITLDKGAVVAMPPTPPGMPQITESVLKEKVTEGSWTMTGEWLFYQALASLPGNMTVETLEVGATGNALTMTAKGKYYVKN
jgi:hypothetical protein